MRNQKYRILTLFILGLLFVSSFSKNLYAGENWDFSIAPYFWFASLSGDATVKGNEEEVDVSFSEVWDALKFGASARFEAYNKPTKFGLLLDAMYLKLEDDSTINLFDGPKGINAEVEFQFLIVEEGIFYRFLELDSARNPRKDGPEVTLDGLFFGRIWYMDNTIDLEGKGPIGISNRISGDQTWFDFNLGLRSSIFLTEKLRTILRMDVGGFGLGFSSDITWSGLGGFGYALTDHIEAVVGFRGLYVNYDDGSGDDRFELDLWMYNPFIALNFTF